MKQQIYMRKEQEKEVNENKEISAEQQNRAAHQAAAQQQHVYV